MNYRYARAMALTLAVISLFCSNMMEEYDDGITPSGVFLVNNGDAKTVSRSVTLSMNISSAVQMRFSNDGAVWSDWEAYSAAKNWDFALGPQLQTVRGEFKSETGQVLSIADSIDPFIEETIVASDGHANDQFGGSKETNYWGTGVSISNDGKSMIVACSFDDISGKTEQGSAYLYKWTGSNWAETKFTADDGALNDYYAWSVAISGDGNRIAIGAMKDAAPNAGQGSVYMYTYNGSTWEKIHFIASDGHSSDQYGVSISLSNTGNTLVVGSYADDVSDVADNYGSVYFYRWNGASWSETKKMASDKNIYAQLGWHVSISGDGNTVIAGAPKANGLEPSSGAGYVYKWNGSDWIETKIFASDGKSTDFFGSSVAISKDGTTIAIGSPWDDINSNMNQGSVYLYKWNGSNWVETKLTASDGLPEDWYGKSVSLSGDGTQLLVGSFLDDYTHSGQGTVYFYAWDGSTWNEEIIRATDGAADDHFGYSVFISGDGGTYGITAPGSNVGSNADQGRIYLY
jgi:hypothetical protein